MAVLMFDKDECPEINDYEAYVYICLNDKTDEIYWGFAFHGIYDPYWFSSANKKFRTSYVENRDDWKKIIVKKGNRFDMSDFEFNSIKKELKNNKDKCMNIKPTGNRYLQRVSEEDKVFVVIEKINKSLKGEGPYNIKDKPKKDMYKLKKENSYQHRNTTTAGIIKEMSDKMNDRSGVLDKKNYMTHGGIYQGKDYLINGNNTCDASEQTQEIFRNEGTIPYMEIDEKDLFELGDNGIDTLARTLNPQYDNPRQPESSSEAVEWASARVKLEKSINSKGEERIIIKNRDSLSRLLDLRGYSSNAISSILRNAKDEVITKNIGDTNNQTWIKYSETPEKLNDKVKKTKNNFTASVGVSTTKMGTWASNDLIVKRDKKGKLVNFDKKVIHIITHSPNYPTYLKWKKRKQQLENDMNDFSWRGKKWQVIIEDMMPQWRDKKNTK